MEEEQKDSNIDILEYAKTLVKHSNFQEEKNFIFIGEQASGKTTVFNLLFSNKKEKAISGYNQTCGINFNNATANFNNYKKIIMNGYELGGGLESLSLVNNIAHENNFNNTLFVIVIDLSKPETIVNSLKNINEKLKECCSGFDNDMLNRNISEKRGMIKNENDINHLQLMPWKVVVVGTKYDLFEKFDV